MSEQEMARNKRLREALRENLKRRKLQARGRAEPDAKPDTMPDATPDDAAETLAPPRTELPFIAVLILFAGAMIRAAIRDRPVPPRPSRSVGPC